MHARTRSNAFENQKHRDFITVAEQVAERSNCIRRSVGAILVRDGQVISEGWNGVSEEFPDCGAAGCPRCINGGNTGSGYENCICIHAEQRAIAVAASRGIGTENSTLYVNLRPCLQCLAICKASGVREVYFSGENWEYPPDVRAVYHVLAGQFEVFSRVDDLQRLAVG